MTVQIERVASTDPHDTQLPRPPRKTLWLVAGLVATAIAIAGGVALGVHRTSTTPSDQTSHQGQHANVREGRPSATPPNANDRETRIPTQLPKQNANEREGRLSTTAAAHERQ